MRPSLPVILPPSFLTFRQLPLPVISTKRQRAEKSQSPMSSLPRLFDFTLTVISTERSEWRNLSISQILSISQALCNNARFLHAPPPDTGGRLSRNDINRNDISNKKCCPQDELNRETMHARPVFIRIALTRAAGQAIDRANFSGCKKSFKSLSKKILKCGQFLLTK